MSLGPAGWLLLGAACWLGGRSRPSPAGHRLVRGAATWGGSPVSTSTSDGDPPRGRRLPPRALPVLAVLATGFATIGILGPVAGLLAGAAIAPFVLVAIARLPASARAGADPRLPVTLDVLATVLRAGQPLGGALDAVAPIAGSGTGAKLRGVSGMLRLGASAEDAWAPLRGDPALSPVVRIATRSAQSGIRLAAECTGLAAELRSVARTTSQARAQRAGVFAMAPLGLCFLPAFVCLGVVPVVAGIAGTVLGGMR